MQSELVEKRRWISQSRFQQLAIYVGWLLHRTWGGIVAGVFFVIPSMHSSPGRAAVDWFAVIVSLVAFIGMLRWRWDIIPVVLSA